MVVKRSDFQPYGEEVFSVERTTALGYTAADSIRKKFTGYERDSESGLDFAQARYYNSSHGRFTSVDPLTASATIRNPQTFNRYSYGLNSPYKFIDPLGLLSEYATGACGSNCPNSESRWLQSGMAGYTDNYAAFLCGSFECPQEKAPVVAATSPQTGVHEAGHALAEPPPDPPVVTGYEIITSGTNNVPDTPHKEVDNAETLGFVDTTYGGYLLMNVAVSFAPGTQPSDYYPVRTVFILNSEEKRSGDKENPQSGNIRIDGQTKYVFDEPGLTVSPTSPKAVLENTTFAAVFVQGEINKSTGILDSNLLYYGIKIKYGKNGAINRAASGAWKISRDQFIKYSGIKNPEKSLK